MVANPFAGDLNQPVNVRYRLVRHNSRPTASHPAFKDLTAAELAIAQKWYDEAHTEMTESDEREANRAKAPALDIRF